MGNIIITGANQGIGYYMVKQLLKDGNRIAVLDLETDNLTELKEQYLDKLLYFKVDVRNEEEIQYAVAETVAIFLTLDVVIHNACRCTFETEADTDYNTYKDVFDVNYFGALRLMKSTAPYLSKQKSGKVIFTSSGVGVTGFMGISPYASTKGALEALAKCLRIEYAKDNVSFHLFHPPLTRTQSASPLPVPKEFMATPEKVGQGFAKHINSRRFIICNSVGQKIQIMLSYLLPLKIGKLMSKMTVRYIQQEQNTNR